MAMQFDAATIEQALAQAHDAPTLEEREMALHALGYRIQRPSQRADRMHAAILPGGHSYVSAEMIDVLEWTERYEAARRARIEREMKSAGSEGFATG